MPDATVNIEKAYNYNIRLIMTIIITTVMMVDVVMGIVALLKRTIMMKRIMMISMKLSSEVVVSSKCTILFCSCRAYFPTLLSVYTISPKSEVFFMILVPL